MTDPYYVSIRPGDYRAVVAALRAHRAGRLQCLKLWVRRPGGPVTAPWALYPWDVDGPSAGYWLRATRGDYDGLDAVVGYSHRDAQWTEQGA